MCGRCLARREDGTRSRSIRALRCRIARSPRLQLLGGRKGGIATIRKHFGQLSQLETTQWVTAYNDTDGIEATESFSRNIDDAGTGKLTHRTQVLWSLTDQPGSDFSSCEGRLDQQYPDSEGMLHHRT